MSDDEIEIETRRNSPFLPAVVLAQILSVVSVAALASDLIDVGFVPILYEAVAYWDAIIYRLFDAVGLSAVPSDLRNGIVLAVVLVIPVIRLWLRLWLQPRRMLRREGTSSLRLRFNYGAVASFFIALLTSFARVVVAPFLASAIVINLTWNIHVWVYDTYALNGLLWSIGTVIAGTCLLLALGLQRLLPTG